MLTCAAASPSCTGPVRLYLSGRLCSTHAPWAVAGHPDPHLEHGPFCVKCHKPIADWWAKTAEFIDTGRCLPCQRDPHPLTAEEQRDVKMGQAEAAASAEWKDAARAAIWWLACNRREFTTDDVWDLLQERGVPEPREPRALGPLVFKALRSGAIRDTGRMGRSQRRHATKITVYERTPS